MSEMDSLFGDQHERCPFCKARDQRCKDLWRGQFKFIACRNCKAAGPIARTEEEAWRAWDERGVKNA